MESLEHLYADEVLTPSSQEETPSPEEVQSLLAQVESLSPSLRSSRGLKRKTVEKEEVTLCEVSKSKKKRGRGNTSPPSSENSHTSHSFKMEDTLHSSATDVTKFFAIENIVLPDSCSLFNTVALSWSLKTSLKFLSFTTSHFAYAPPTKKIKNGIWLKLNLSSADQEAINKDLYLLLELYERHVNADDAGQKDQLVAFCSGKCGNKKQEIISLQEKKLHVKPNATYEAIIAINEQCAHRSDNEYGSPNTRFYFRLQLCEKIATEDGIPKMISITSADSSLIKVVAPGKSKPPAKPKKVQATAARSAAKVTIKSMLETFLITMQNMDDRLTRLEKKIEERPVMVKGEERIKGEVYSEIPYNAPQYHSSPVKQQPQQPSLRRSCEFSFDDSAEFLSLSQEINMMIQDPTLLTPE